MKGKSMMDTLFQWGITSYVLGIETSISTANQRNIPIAKQIEQPVGLIFGFSIQTDTVTPANDPLITTANAENLYLNLKDGNAEFFMPVRLDQMIFNFSGFPNTNEDRFMRVNIKGNFDLSTSYYSNPTGIVSVEDEITTILLQMWYISTESYLFLIEKGVVVENAGQYLRTKR